MAKKFKYEAPKVMDLTGFSASGQDPLACGFGAVPAGGPGGDACNTGWTAGTNGCSSGYTVSSVTCVGGFGVANPPAVPCSVGYGDSDGCGVGYGQGSSLCGTGSFQS